MSEICEYLFRTIGSFETFLLMVGAAWCGGISIAFMTTRQCQGVTLLLLVGFVASAWQFIASAVLVGVVCFGWPRLRVFLAARRQKRAREAWLAQAPPVDDEVLASLEAELRDGLVDRERFRS